MSTIFTRNDYMNVTQEAQTVAHRRYYSQFVNDSIRRLVSAHIGVSAIKASIDSSLNDIPLYKWDELHPLILANLQRRIVMELTGNTGWSLGDSVCVAKEAAKQLRDDCLQSSNQGNNTVPTAE